MAFGRVLLSKTNEDLAMEDFLNALGVGLVSLGQDPGCSCVTWTGLE